jgi:hypothetical protein
VLSPPQNDRGQNNRGSLARLCDTTFAAPATRPPLRDHVLQ